MLFSVDVRRALSASEGGCCAPFRRSEEVGAMEGLIGVSVALVSSGPGPAGPLEFALVPCIHSTSGSSSSNNAHP